MLGPGMPVPGVSCAGAVARGANRLCANAPAGAKRTGAKRTAAKATAATMAATAQRRKSVPRPHQPIALFFETNRGNFKPRRAGRSVSRREGAPNGRLSANRLPGDPVCAKPWRDFPNFVFPPGFSTSAAFTIFRLAACCRRLRGRSCAPRKPGRRSFYRVGCVIRACKE